MAGTLSDETGVGSSSEGISNAQQRCQAGEALAEWRSSEQVENGTPSTSPPFWNADDDDDCGPKPSELYGKYTWKIDKFSQINKRELRSNAFEIGGYKWYILIYPQGCDVCNHLSLFLCVANHDDLLPGWSHFAQFTIAVVNKDPRKSKYSDTLHRFWKKEHDWGWKKFMELTKVRDGFVDSDTLIIKAQVQVIRERVDRPFRCLDTQYRRELVRVYLSNVEQICRRYLEEVRLKIGGIIDDAPRWSSFCTYWLGIDLNARRSLSRKKKDSQMFKEAVKRLFVEKEVTSTLVMDSLYSGIKSLEGEIKNNKARAKYFDEEVPMPIVLVDNNTFVLVEDVVILLEKAAVETLPSKDEKGPPNRSKDGSYGEDFTREMIERDERRLTEIGRRTIEIIVAEYIFSNKIEVAYQETVALRVQEELLREEEAAWLAVSDKKAKRGAAEKEKKSKKKQGKQKRNNRKGKDKGRDAKPVVDEKWRQESRTDERKEVMSEVAEVGLEKPDMIDDVSDMSDSIECATEDREYSPINWDTDASEVHPPTEASGSGVNGLSAVINGGERKSPSVRDDSSSTCSTDSLLSVVMNGSYKGNSIPNKKTQKSPSRRWSQRGWETCETTGWTNDTHRQTSECLSDVGHANDLSENCQVAESKTEAVLLSLQDRVKRLEQHVVKKEEEDVSLQRKLSVKGEVNTETPPKKNTTEVPSPNKLPSAIHLKPDSKISGPTNPNTIKKPDIDNNTQRTNKAAAETAPTSRPYARNALTPKPTEKPIQQAVVPTEKPTAPQVPVTSRPITPVVSLVQIAPLLSRSASAAGQLGPDLSPMTHSSGPQNASPAGRLGLDPSPPPTHSYGGPKNTSAAGRLGPDPPSSTHSYSGPQNVSPSGRLGPDPSPPPTHSYGGPKNTSPAGRLGPDPPPLTHSYSGPQNASPAGRLGPELSPSTHSYGGPQSYRNAMMGNSVNSMQSYSQPPALVSTPMMGNSVNSLQTYSQLPMMGNSVNSTQSYSQPPALVSTPVFLPPSSKRTDPNAVRPSFSYGMVNNLQNFDLYRHAHSKSQDHFPAEVPAGQSQRQTVMADDFPHLDIINELLDDEFQNFSNGPWSGAHNLNRQYTFPGDLGMLNDVGPSTTNSRLSERTRSYNDNVFEQGYPQANNLGAYSNGRIDGQVPNQWQMNGSDLSYLSLRNGEGDGYPYHIPGYSNLPYGVDGYTVYRP